MQNLLLNINKVLKGNFHASEKIILSEIGEFQVIDGTKLTKDYSITRESTHFGVSYSNYFVLINPASLISRHSLEFSEIEWDAQFDTVQIWEVGNTQENLEIKVKGVITTFFITKDQTLLLVIITNTGIDIRDTKTGSRKFFIPAKPHDAIALGNKFAVLTSDESFEVWSFEGIREYHSVKEGLSNTLLKLSNHEFITHSYSGNLYLWNLRTKSSRPEALGRDLKLIRKDKISKRIRDVILLSDGSLACLNVTSNLIEIWSSPLRGKIKLLISIKIRPGVGSSYAGVIVSLLNDEIAFLDEEKNVVEIISSKTGKRLKVLIFKNQILTLVTVKDSLTERILKCKLRRVLSPLPRDLIGEVGSFLLSP